MDCCWYYLPRWTAISPPLLHKDEEILRTNTIRNLIEIRRGKAENVTSAFATFRRLFNINKQAYKKSSWPIISTP